MIFYATNSDGMEATMYAILAGTQNLGANLANYMGACLLKVGYDGLHFFFVCVRFQLSKPHAVIYAQRCHTRRVYLLKWAFTSYASQLLQVQPEGATNEGKQFDNLWLAALLSTLLPLVVHFSLEMFLLNCCDI